MRKTQAALIYAAMFTASTGAFFLIRSYGQTLAAPQEPLSVNAIHPPAPPADAALAQVLLALVVVIVVARVFGAVLQRIAQPRVIGEMIAGILLGPSLLGRLAPGISAQLFPPAILPFLSVIAQIGVILYMFLVGVGLDTKQLRERLAISIAISQASIAAPFLLGSALALWLYPLLSTRSVLFSEFALFLGVSMSVTAFPVLARILTDRQMQHTRIGTIAMACAAAADVTAWCLLAFVVSFARAQPGQALLTAVLTAGFIAAIFFVAQPGFGWLARRQTQKGQAATDAIVIVCAALLLAALATERIGIHALFGAFLIGMVVPHDSVLASDIRAKLEDAVALSLLPVFFVFTGLRTEIGLMHGVRGWLICIAIIGVASAGKFGGSFLAALATGSDWREAASLGALMNTRGLMELIVLNVGLDLGVISPTLFAMLVLMAVVTTVATTPILQAGPSRIKGSLSEHPVTPD